MNRPNRSPVQQLTADAFAALVFAATDEQILEGIRVAGTRQVLDRIFGEMEQRFRPERVAGGPADVQWVITDESEEDPYRMSIAEGRCTVARGRHDNPAVTLTLDVVSFAKLVTGRREGVQLWMLKKLKIDGDLMLSVRLQGYFDRPARPRSDR